MSTNSRKYLRRPFDSNVRPGHDVLIVTDTAQDPRVWQAAHAIVSELDASPTVALFNPRPADYYDPPEVVAEAMLRSDVNVLLASTSMLHSPAAMAAMAAGIPTICMDGAVTIEMFESGAASADYFEISRLKHYAALNVFGADARECRVTSRWGTDLTYGVAGRVHVPPLREAGWDPFKAYRRVEEGRANSPMYACLFPTGEFNVPPLEGTGNGTLVIDLTMHHLGRLTSPIELVVRDGRITEVNGGADAKRLREHLERHGDDNAYMFPTEASVGLNKNAVVVGTQREDKNIYGAMHFGLGTNSDVGGAVTSNLHMDGVVLEPTLYVDGVKKIDQGRFLVPLDKAL